MLQRIFKVFNPELYYTLLKYETEGFKLMVIYINGTGYL